MDFLAGPLEEGLHTARSAISSAHEKVDGHKYEIGQYPSFQVHEPAKIASAGDLDGLSLFSGTDLYLLLSSVDAENCNSATVLAYWLLGFSYAPTFLCSC